MWLVGLCGSCVTGYASAESAVLWVSKVCKADAVGCSYKDLQGSNRPNKSCVQLAAAAVQCLRT